MTTILNYLKGNYLLSNFSFLSTLECHSPLNDYSYKLLTFSIAQNQKPNDRNIIIIDFDLRLKGILNPSSKISCENLEILSEKNLFFIPVRKTFLNSTKINDFIFESKGLENLIKILKEKFTKLIDTTKPGILYIFGIEILEFYFKTDEIISFLVQTLKDLPFIKQIFVNFRTNILSEELIITIKKLSTAQIILEKEINSPESDKKKAKIKLLVNKKNGYSIQEDLILTYDLIKENAIFEKFKEETKQDENPEELHKYFNTTFNLNITESQKKSKEQMVLPFMNVQNQSEMNKQNLIELENEDVDLEDDDDDDIDV